MLFVCGGVVRKVFIGLVGVFGFLVVLMSLFIGSEMVCVLSR